MIINRVRVRRFRAIREGRIIEFSAGLNIIKGSDNEAGKSSLRMAITKALFQDPNSSREDIVGLTSWGAEDPWELELDFESDSGPFRIVKSLKTKTSQLVDARSSRAIASSKSAIAAKVTEFTGCPSETFFESTACISQDEMIRIVPKGASPNEQQKAMGTVTQRLQSSLSGRESVDVRSILAKLISKSTRKDAKGPYYHLLQLNERMSSLQNQKADQEGKVRTVIENRRKLNAVKEQLGRIDTDLPPLEELLKKNKRILELEAEIEAGRRQYENFGRARGLKSELERLDEELREFAPFFDADEKMRLVADARAESERLKMQRSHLEDDLEAINMDKPALWPVAIGVVVLLLGIVLGIVVEPYWSAAALPGILLLVYWLDRWLGWRRQVRLAKARLLKLEVPVRKNEQALRTALGPFGFQDYDEYVKQLSRCDYQIDKRNEIANKLSGITGDSDWSAFQLENRDLDLQVSAKQKELTKLLSFKMAPIDLQKLESQVSQLQKQKAELESDKSGLEKFFEYSDVDTDQLAAVDEQLKWLEQEAEFWERKKKVYDITRETLEEAYKQALARAATVLEKELGKYISTITDGRYSRVEINERDLGIWTYSAENNERVNVRDLSRATQDQFYISARFALVKLVTEGKKPPMLLDDPFVNFHPKRLKRMIGLLQELARENQILLFTCSDVYDPYGNVILLD